MLYKSCLIASVSEFLQSQYRAVEKGGDRGGLLEEEGNK